VEAQAKRAFWALITDQLSSAPPQYDTLVGLVEEIFQMLQELAPGSDVWEAELSRCDMALLKQQATHAAVGLEDLAQALDVAAHCVVLAGSIAEEEEAMVWKAAVVGKVMAAAKEDDGGVAMLSAALPDIIESFWRRITCIRRAITQHRIAPALQELCEHGVEYEKLAFEKAYGAAVGASPAMTLPRTVAWIRSTLSTAPSLSATPVLAHHVVAEGVAALLTATSAPREEQIPETLQLDWDAGRLTRLHEAVGRLAKAASIGLLVKQALVKAGVPAAVATEIIGDGVAATQVATASVAATQVPTGLRTGFAVAQSPDRAAPRLSTGCPGQDPQVVNEGGFVGVSRPLVPLVYELLEDVSVSSVLTVIDSICASTCSSHGCEHWTDSCRQQLATACKAAISGSNPVAKMLRARVSKIVRNSLLEAMGSPTANAAMRAGWHGGLSGVSRPLDSLIAEARSMAKHTMAVHAQRYGALLASSSPSV
jgi:hypothetical protein